MASFLSAVPSPASLTVDSPSSSSGEVQGEPSTYLGGLPFEQRDQAKALIASVVGIRVPTTWVPRGSALLPIGEAKLAGIRAEYDRLPMLAAGLDAYSARLTAEKALDVPVNLRSMRMERTAAGLYGEGQDPSKALAYSKAGFSHVAGFIKPPEVRNGFAENLLAMPATLRSEWFNHCAQNARTVDSQVTIRTIIAPGEDRLRRVVRAVTSDRHSLGSGDDSAIVAALRGLTSIRGAKVRITREGPGERSWFEVLWPAVDRQIRVGDSLAFGVRFRNSETKAGSLVVEPFLFDAICYNLTTAYSTLADEGDFTLRHVGDLSKRLPGIVIRAQKTIEPFVKAFGDAYRTPFPTSAPSRGEVLAKIGKALELSESTLSVAAQLWDADGSASAGDTLAGAANALTRAAQGETMEAAEVTMRAAGRLVSQGWGALEA